MGVELGLQIVPTMPAAEVIDTIQMAEELGYAYCAIADEGFMLDVYALMGAAARTTSTIRLGAVTNPYTRHPAVTAAGLATVNDLSAGRAFVILVAGGTMVLNPMGIDRKAPLSVMRDAIEMLRLLWSGEPVSWQGKSHKLVGAQLSSGPQEIDIWVAARGDRMLALAGECGDGVVVMAKTDLAAALEKASAGGSGMRMYQDRLAYTPEMIAEAKELYAYALMDAPQRMLDNLGISNEVVDQVKLAMAQGGPPAVAALVTNEMVAAFQIVGDRDQCRSDLHGLVIKHDIDVFMINVTTTGLEANRRLLEDVASFTKEGS